MRSWKSIFYNTIFGGNCLLVFLLLTENRLIIPHWLQVGGRMHPLVLHFPLVLAFLTIIWEIFFTRKKQDNIWGDIGDGLILITAFSAMATAIMGMLLSREPGYDAEAIMVHKWVGILLSVLMMAWYVTRNFLRQNRGGSLVVSAVTILALLITGHEGASITHGDNFLLAPVTKEVVKPKVSLNDARVYADVIHPIIEAKCLGCHNSKKAKGELVMETAAGLYKGGKNGKLWDTASVDLGLFLKRVHLPLDDKKHMPPKGKLQLSEEESTLLALWFKAGADTTSRLLELDPADSLRILAAVQFTDGGEEQYEFPAASDNSIKSLNNFYRLVSPIAAESPALQANFYGASQFKSQALQELLKVKDQVVSIELNKMPVRDIDLQTIAQFRELRELNLSFTEVSDSGIGALLTMPKLKRLSLSGTKVTAAGIRKLMPIKNLQYLYCWSTSVKDEDLVSIRKTYPAIQVDNGFNGDTIKIRLNPPIIENEEDIITGAIPLRLKHFIRGAELRYTIDGTEPDSITSAVYTSKAEINDGVTLKAKAFKDGWISSETVSRIFYKKGLMPDESHFVMAPDSGYTGNGSLTLFDGIKGDENFKSGKWIGFRKKEMDLGIRFNSPQTVSMVKISTLIDISGYIMPPEEIQVWGSEAGKPLKSLVVLRPKQPVKDSSSYQTFFELSFRPTTLQNMRILVKPVLKLPKWHGGKGERGWIFTDEIFIR